MVENHVIVSNRIMVDPGPKETRGNRKRIRKQETNGPRDVLMVSNGATGMTGRTIVFFCHMRCVKVHAKFEVMFQIFKVDDHLLYLHPLLY